MDRERVVIAELFRARGIRGELVARSQTDIPGRLENLKRAHVRLANGNDIAVEIEDAWPHKGDWVLKFTGVDDMDAANVFRGADLWVPPEERGELPEGGFFQSDLVGCSVVDKLSGQALGTVAGFQEFGGPTLMEMTLNGREVLIPFVEQLCEVDLPARVIRVDLPDGLLDL